MRRIFSLAVLSLLFAAPLAHAATKSVYATAVYSASNQVYQPQNILGAPDGQYASFLDRYTSTTLDFGKSVNGDLTLTYQLLQYGARYSVDFYDAAFIKIATKGDLLGFGTETIVPYTGSGAYRYVSISSDATQRWNLDALTAHAEETAALPALTPTIVPVPAPVLGRGSLVKLADDGNPSTTVDAAVYVLGIDGQRHAFPSSAVFYTWFKDFSDIRVIDTNAMASHALGKNVTVRPGTSLVKITTDPHVYAVEPGGVLRWIKTEDLAATLYGPSWAKRVMDIPDVFFLNYSVGPDINATVHPTGTLGLLELPTGARLFIRHAVQYAVSAEIAATLHFDFAQYSVILSRQTYQTYIDGGPLALDPAIQYPY